MHGAYAEVGVRRSYIMSLRFGVCIVGFQRVLEDHAGERSDVVILQARES